MIRVILIAIAVSMTIQGCNGPKKEVTKKTTENTPLTNIKVNKEYDKNGNLVKYDSSYSYYYSNIQGNNNLRDSILNNFKNHFNEKYFFSNQPYFNNFFFQDSLLGYDFYKKDFFFDRFKNNMSQMNTLFREMDSVKNEFFKDQFKSQKNIKK